MVDLCPLCRRSAHMRKEAGNWVRVQTDDLAQLELTAPRGGRKLGACANRRLMQLELTAPKVSIFHVLI